MQKKGEPFISSLILPYLYLTWSQNMTVVWSLEQRMTHLPMPLKVLQSMFFSFLFLEDNAKPIIFCPEGRIMFTTRSRGSSIGAPRSKNVKSRGRLQHASGTSGRKIEKYVVMTLLMCDSFLKLKLGADGARVDDTNRLKTSVANWLNNVQDHPECLLKPEDKLSHGFHHAVTGWLLCPVAQCFICVIDLPTGQWEQLMMFVSVWSAIRECHPRYPVTTNMYSAFLYDGYYDPKNPSKGLFQGKYLLKVGLKYDYCAPIFVLRLI